MVVEKSIGVMNLPNERGMFLTADHQRVAMFASRDDSSYVTVRNALAKAVASLHGPTACNTVQYVAGVRVDEESISRLLDVSGASEEDLMNYDALPGSCEWLAKKEYFKTWKGAGISRLL